MTEKKLWVFVDINNGHGVFRIGNGIKIIKHLKYGFTGIWMDLEYLLQVIFTEAM